MHQTGHYSGFNHAGIDYTQAIAANVVDCFQTIWRMPSPHGVLRKLSRVGANG